MKRCNRCILPESVPGIRFDDQDGCNYCGMYQEHQPLGVDALRQKMERHRRVGAAYDCIVPCSGGRDSSYVLYFVARELGLRPLAVNFDNEFATEQAVANIRAACDKLAATLRRVGSGRSLASKVVHHNLLSSDRYADLNLCRACSYGMYSIIYGTAAELGIPMVVWGDSRQESTQAVKKAVGKHLAKKRGRERYLNPHYLHYEYFYLRQRMEFPVKGNSLWSRGTPQLRIAGIEEIHLFDFVEWDRGLIKKTIQEELGWRAPEGSVSTWRTDCAIAPLINFIHTKIYGCTKSCFGYGNMIRSGKMTRDEALAQENSFLASLTDDFAADLMTRVLGLSPQQARTIVSTYR
ncbi:MAG: hypothetical protein AB1634_08540 [Thermodesulfobacteriota bacterium]